MEKQKKIQIRAVAALILNVQHIFIFMFIGTFQQRTFAEASASDFRHTSLTKHKAVSKQSGLIMINQQLLFN